MNYRNKAIIYEVDDDRVIIDEYFNDIIEKYDFIIIDSHTLGEEIINNLSEREIITIDAIYKEISYTTDKIKEDIANNAIDYIYRNYPEKYHE